MLAFATNRLDRLWGLSKNCGAIKRSRTGIGPFLVPQHLITTAASVSNLPMHVVHRTSEHLTTDAGVCHIETMRASS